MSFSEVESAVMDLPVDERRRLAQRIWSSIEFPDDEAEALLRECDRREAESDREEDGWMPVDDFMSQMKNRAP